MCDKVSSWGHPGVILGSSWGHPKGKVRKGQERSGKVKKGQDRSGMVMEGHGRSYPNTRCVNNVRKVMDGWWHSEFNLGSWSRSLLSFVIF